MSRLTRPPTPPAGPAFRLPLVAVAAVLLLTVPLVAGCIGGGSPSDGVGAGVPPGDSSNDSDLPPGVESSTDLRPHVHDRWFDPTTGEAVAEVVLVEASFELQPYNASRPALVEGCEVARGAGQGTRTCLGWTEVVPGRWSDGTPKVVPPATDRLEVTVRFEPDDFAGIDLHYQHRNSQGRWSHLTNASGGGPFEPAGDDRDLRVGLRMSDDGHAQVSSWRFGLAPYGDPLTGGDNGAVDAGSGTVEVRIVAHRREGPLPLEPPHPLFWDADDPPTDTYLVGRLEGSTAGFLQAGRLAFEPDRDAAPKLSGQGLAWRIPVGFHGARTTQGEYPPPLDDPFARALVPPGSQLVAVRLRVEGATTQGGDAEVCVLGVDRPGAGFPSGGERDRSLVGECQPFRDGEATLVRPVTDRDTDSYYVNTSAGISLSRWTFYVHVVPATVAGQRGASSFQGNVAAEFFVTDRAEFELPAWAEDAAPAS